MKHRIIENDMNYRVEEYIEGTWVFRKYFNALRCAEEWIGAQCGIDGVVIRTYTNGMED